MTEPKTHTLDVPGAVLTYDVRSNAVQHGTGPHADRVADGRRRLRHAGRPLRRPDGRDLRPPRRRSAVGRPTPRPSRRPRSTPTTCTG